MKSKIESIIKQLGSSSQIKWSSDNQGYFSTTNKNKKTIGRFVLYDDNVQTIIDFTNYSKNYLRSKIKNTFNEFDAGVSEIDYLNYQPQPNDVIRVHHIDGLDPNQEITLSSDTYYFSINDSYIDCDGRRLRQDVEARYLDSEENRCLGAYGNTVYSLFQLLEN